MDMDRLIARGNVAEMAMALESQAVTIAELQRRLRVVEETLALHTRAIEDVSKRVRAADGDTLRRSSGSDSQSAPNETAKSRRGSTLSRAAARAAVMMHFGGSLEHMMIQQFKTHPDEKGPVVLATMLRLLRAMNGTREEGIFRLSGSLEAINRLKAELNRGRFDLTPDAVRQEFGDDVNVLACCLKQWVAELAQPLMPAESYEAALAAADGGAVEVARYVEGLPALTRFVLLELGDLMREVDANVATSRMNCAALAVVFAPGMFRSNVTKDPLEMVASMARETRFVELVVLEAKRKASVSKVGSAAWEFEQAQQQQRGAVASMSPPKSTSSSQQGSAAVSPRSGSTSPRRSSTKRVSARPSLSSIDAALLPPPPISPAGGAKE